MPDERREGTKKGAGRPKGSKNKLLKEQRKLHQLRAHDEEWALINDFARQIKHGNKALCESFLNDLKIGAIFVDTTSNFEKIWMEMMALQPTPKGVVLRLEMINLQRLSVIDTVMALPKLRL